MQHKPLACRLIAHTILILVLGVARLWGDVAHASLGGDEASVVADGAAFQALLRAVDRTQYVLHELTAPTGVRVREYLGSSGTVFAVAWSGPVVPDLQALLGAHYADYVKALAGLTSPGLHRSVRLVLPGAVVESSGHLRAYAGRAYLPGRIPAGVTPGELN